MVVGGLGVQDVLCEQLASADVDFAHAGLPVVRLEADGASFHEPAAARCKYGFAFFGDEARYGWFVAERFCGGAFCVASAACGIGGMDRGKEGRAERVFPFAHDLDVYQVCGGIRVSSQ